MIYVATQQLSIQNSSILAWYKTVYNDGSLLILVQLFALAWKALTLELYLTPLMLT